MVPKRGHRIPSSDVQRLTKATGAACGENVPVDPACFSGPFSGHVPASSTVERVNGMRKDFLPMVNTILSLELLGVLGMVEWEVQVPGNTP